MDSFKPLLGKAATGASLSRAEAEMAFDHMLSGEVTPAQMGAFLMALRVRGETVEEITGAVRAMRAKMLVVQAPAGAIDIVGTGGDSSGSYNVSTLASVITAACGVPIAKHGNRAASSKSGASDVLSALGVAVGVTPAQVEACIRDAGIGFMAAPTHHAATRHVAPVVVISSSPSEPCTSQTFSEPRLWNTWARGSSRAREKTPTSWRFTLAGFDRGPRMLKIVRVPSSTRTGATWRVAA